MAAFLAVLGSILHLNQRKPKWECSLGDECLVLLVGSSHWGAGTFYLHPYLTGLLGCLCGLLDVWPISHCGVMQVLFGIFFVSNLYLGKNVYSQDTLKQLFT
jgi:hypothetical protein